MTDPLELEARPLIKAELADILRQRGADRDEK
jgi:hypothetical protein